MYGYAGRSDPRRYARQIEQAFESGDMCHRKTNTKITFKGAATFIGTFTGSCWIVSGMLSFFHYGNPVFQVDFDNNRVTDFGYYGYSMTTSNNLRGWQGALRDLNLIRTHIFPRNACIFDWTCTDRTSRRGTHITNLLHRGKAGEMFRRFRERAPWVRVIDGVYWFCADQYDERLEREFWSTQDGVMQDSRWHWYTADWDVDGNWNYRFIDAAAQKRWHARTRQHAQLAETTA